MKCVCIVNEELEKPCSVYGEDIDCPHCKYCVGLIDDIDQLHPGEWPVVMSTDNEAVEVMNEEDEMDISSGMEEIEEEEQRMDDEEEEGEMDVMDDNDSLHDFVVSGGEGADLWASDESIFNEVVELGNLDRVNDLSYWENDDIPEPEEEVAITPTSSSADELLSCSWDGSSDESLQEQVEDTTRPMVAQPTARRRLVFNRILRRRGKAKNYQELSSDSN